MGIRAAIISFVVALLSISSIAQETPPVHKINGKKYYLHVVEKGNTLYGISKLYNLSIADIELENPVLKSDGLKVNQTLLIPVTKENKKDLGGVVEQTSEYITHEVQSKETLYSISRQYNTTLADLILANPSVKSDGLKAGTEIKIPVQKIEVDIDDYVVVAEPDSLQSHIIEKGETLYSLSKRYGVSMEELLKANPDLRSDLRIGMAIRIPGLKNKDYSPSKPAKQEVSADTVKVYIPDSTTLLRIGLLIPLKPSFPDSGDTEFKIPEAQRIALSFYRGFLFAADSLAESLGLRLHINLLESGDDTVLISKLIRKGALDTLDVIVGPFYTSQFEYVADYTGKRGTPTICPIPKPSKILFKRPNAIKMTPSESMVLDGMAQFLAANYKDSNLVLVNSNKFRDADNIEFFKARYASALNVPDTFINDAIREIKLWDINRETLSLRFKDTGDYTLIVPSTDKVFVSKLLGGLYNFQYDSKGAIRFRVFGMEEWQKFDSDLDIDVLQELGVTLPLPEYVNHSDYRTKHFVSNFYRTHRYEPDRFVLVGYDVGAYVLKSVAEYKKAWFKDPTNFGYQGVLIDVKHARVHQESGLENQHFDIYQYNHFRQKKVAEWPPIEKK